MTETCAFSFCEEKAVHVITDAVEFPDEWNGKKICKEHKELRELCKYEPDQEEDKKKEITNV
jgi:hypothetical protein